MQITGASGRGISAYNLNRGRVELSAICDAHKIKVCIEQLYNPGENRKSVSLRSDQLEKRCFRENQHPAEGALGPPIEQLELKRRCWNEDHVPLGWALRPPVEQPRRTGKKHCYGYKSGGQYVAVLFSLQLPLTHNPFKKVRGIFF